MTAATDRVSLADVAASFTKQDVEAQLLCCTGVGSILYVYTCNISLPVEMALLAM